MTIKEYELRFETELEEAWNNGARQQYLHWDSFVYAMWSAKYV